MSTITIRAIDDYKILGSEIYMIPNKPMDLLIDQFIEADIRNWVDAKQREAEQLEFEEGNP